MTHTEIVSAFLNYFRERDHLVVPSDSLVPIADPTLLFTSAGMVQFKPYFTGELEPPRPRLASCQKCFRTSDIDEVGDATHLTFFEMLGNFSIGDYFKKGAILYAWQFVTETLGLEVERLWATIHPDDDEAGRLWGRLIGLPAGKIIPLEDNYWGPAGETGPCGPCSEIHYDRGREVGCGRADCAPGCECGRFLELWNLVFMQYNKGAEGQLIPLPRQNIDTGLGLERAAVLMQGVETIYETDLFAPLIAKACALSGVTYGEAPESDRALRVIAEHGRALAFLLADGVMPANEGRGYVLRRLLRRGYRQGRLLGISGPFLGQIAEVTVELMSQRYPELARQRDHILNIIGQEERRFERALAQGSSLLEEMIARTLAQDGKLVSGEDAFQLYDTYGLPLDLTRELAAERGLAVDEGGFQRALAGQRERARAAERFALEDAAARQTYAAVLKSLQERGALPEGGVISKPYQCTSLESVVLAIFSQGRPVESAQAGDAVEVVTAQTPFYAEAGGQMSDSGTLVSLGMGRWQVDVQEVSQAIEGLVVHRGRVAKGTLQEGDGVLLRVDEERRRDIARNHTATHLLQASLRRVLGEQVRQAGSLVAPERLRFDFSYGVAPSPQELAQVEREVNRIIMADLPVETVLTTYREGLAQGAIALFGERYEEEVRLVRVRDGDSPFSQELCGGIHVASTGQIGLFKILSESSIGAGLRRIEAVTGWGAYRALSESMARLEALARRLKAPQEGVEAQLEELILQNEEQQGQIAKLRKQLAVDLARKWTDWVVAVNGIQVLAMEVKEAASMASLRQIGDELRERMETGVIVLGAVMDGRPGLVAIVTPDVVERGIRADELVRRVAQVVGGGGGGRPTLAQAGGRVPEKLPEALAMVEGLIAEMIAGNSAS